MGRGTGSGAPLAPLLRYLHEKDANDVGCSYLYQCSEEVLQQSFNEPETGSYGNQVKWFLNYEGAGGTPVGRQLAAGETATWGEGKANQLVVGNASPDYTEDAAGNALSGVRYGYPFPADLFPVIMCFHHHRWTAANNKTDAKALCVSWNGNVFWSIPKWEHSINPGIPP
jgi:hypothetical protein